MITKQVAATMKTEGRERRRRRENEHFRQHDGTLCNLSASHK